MMLQSWEERLCRMAMSPSNKYLFVTKDAALATAIKQEHGPAFISFMDDLLPVIESSELVTKEARCLTST